MATQGQSPVRVVLIEDSEIQRLALSELLAEGGELQVVGEAATGDEGVRLVKAKAPDLVTCDIGLPDIDGFAVVERIMAEKPTPIVMVTATLAPSWRQPAYHALSLGAVEVMAKPTAVELADRTWRRRLRQQLVFLSRAPVIPHVLTSVRRHTARARRHATVTPVPRPAPVRVVAMVGSAGSPRAVRGVLSALRPAMPLPAPIVIAMHLGRDMEAAFAAYMSHALSTPVETLADGASVTAGHIYVAPGQRHVELRPGLSVGVFDHLPHAVYSPSLDHFLESAAQVAGASAVGVILSGMGADGARGLWAMAQQGALTVAQDEGSSLIFGMPRVAQEMGAARLQGPPELIGQSILGALGLSAGRQK